MAKKKKKIRVIHEVTTPVELAALLPEHVDNMFNACNDFYKHQAVLTVLDQMSNKWLAKAQPPYMHEIYELSDVLKRPGVSTLNLSYEWGCTTGAHNDPSGQGVRLIRALDWPIKGMGDNIVLAKQSGTAGEFYNMTYPGFVGVLNAVAPGRFAIAINIAPIPVHGFTKYVDWGLEKAKKYRSNDMPASFLLRKVFEECATYDDAVDMLSETPICTPALFTIAGVNKDEHAVIERCYNDIAIHSQNSCTSNVWLNDEWKGQGRHNNPPERLRLMQDTHRTARGGFDDWLQFPIKNNQTVLAFEVNPKTGELQMFGAEGGVPVTETLKITL